MSSLAIPREAARRRALGSVLAETLAAHGYTIFLAVPVALLATRMLTQLPATFNVDSWLGLVTGRAVWESGIPHQDTLTLLAHGSTWIDQQWLSQLAMYGLYALGGLALLGLLNVVLVIGAVSFGLVVARRQGAPFLSTLLVLPLAIVTVAPSTEVRTQGLVIPLFMALAWLLTSDRGRCATRTFWCLPVLVLWANLHGSVTLGAGLVVLYAGCSLWERRGDLRADAAVWTRPVLLACGAVAAILVTPYGLSIVDYYRSTMFDGTLRAAVSEWQPLTSAPPAVIVSVAALTLGALWSFLRRSENTTLWAKLAFLGLVISTISVNRNALFLGLFALMIVPVSLGLGDRAAATRTNAARVALNGAIAALTLGVLAVGLITFASRPDSRIEYSAQRPGVLAAVEGALRTDPGLRVMAQGGFADWLLWRDPALTGRLAYDVRFELLRPAQVGAIDALFFHRGRNWKQAARGYRLLVLSRRSDPASATAFLSEPGVRILYNDGQRLVLLRSAAEADRS